jgi:MoaA/NifB/PqqE/SkfB family radical SAM enzyme
MYDKNLIEHIHLESSSRCNAWCTGCMRNKNGFGLVESLVETEIEITTLKKVLEEHENMNHVHFCGRVGDPIVGKNFENLLDLVMSYKKIKFIQISTNGSMKTKEWWEKLAHKLKNINHEIIFGIDGLTDTHKIYRQNTNFEKIIENAKSFIDAGGNTTWQFILFEHNKHQLLEVKKLSKKLGFKNFKLITNPYVPNKSYHFKTGEEYTILPVTNIEKKILVKSDKFLKDTIDIEDCDHLKLKQIFLSYDGKISPCCFLADTSPKSYSIENKWFIKEQFETQNFNKSCLNNCSVNKIKF